MTKATYLVHYQSKHGVWACMKVSMSHPKSPGDIEAIVQELLQEEVGYLPEDFWYEQVEEDAPVDPYKDRISFRVAPYALYNTLRALHNERDRYRYLDVTVTQEDGDLVVLVNEVKTGSDSPMSTKGENE